VERGGGEEREGRQGRGWKRTGEEEKGGNSRAHL